MSSGEVRTGSGNGWGDGRDHVGVPTVVGPVGADGAAAVGDGPVVASADAVARASAGLVDSAVGAGVEEVGPNVVIALGIGVALGAAHPMTARDRVSSATQTRPSDVGRTVPPDASPP
jgi:hypothetical protein